jgi:hypothetical protein
LEKKNEQSRHIGGKPGARDEAENRKKPNTEQPTSDQKNSTSAKPKNADVGKIKKDR